ncbi:MAG: hypothetical protein ACREP7_06110 [Lysobacter sp.]
MSKRLWLATLLLSSACIPSAFAQDAAAPSRSKSAEPSATTTVPKLKIAWECGECEHNDKVPPLIEQAYAEQAQQHSATVSEQEVAEVAITDIRQRPPGVRVMFGIMAGRDRLALRIRYHGQEFEVSEKSSNIVQGLNSLSESVGKQAYSQLAGKAAP